MAQPLAPAAAARPTTHRFASMYSVCEQPSASTASAIVSSAARSAPHADASTVSPPPLLPSARTCAGEQHLGDGPALGALPGSLLLRHALRAAVAR